MKIKTFIVSEDLAQPIFINTYNKSFKVLKYLGWNKITGQMQI